MLNRFIQIFLLIIIITAESFGQGIDEGPGYQMVMINNPALSGSEGDGKLRMSYLNFYPGNNYNLHSLFLSYDSYFPALHGGAGFYLSDDYLGGVVNELKGGLSYSYFLQAGKDLFINAGLSASFYHRGYNFEKAVLPDQIDPLGGTLLPSSELLAAQGRTVFDIGAGFVFISGKLSGGFSVNHLAEPDPTETGLSNDRVKRKLFLHLTGDVDINRTKELKMRPVGFVGMQGEYISGGAGAAFETNKLSVNAILFGSSEKNMNIQTGFSFNAGRVRFFYNYRFNIISGNSLLPLSLLHQTGMALILNNVDKRNAVKTINFPQL
jgi:type IX secretion system PorP/SprF family membrane protein